MTDPTLLAEARAAYTIVLFLSVDLSGSTAFKFSNDLADRKAGETDADPVHGWFSVIQKFYRHFNQSFLTRFNGEASTAQRPRLWKALGDELIYMVEVTETQFVASTVRRFVDAVFATRHIVRDMSRSLDLKASAWLADFPARNAIVDLNGLHDPLQEKPSAARRFSASAEYDYIGPSMDAGFRLGKLASRRKMPLSVELAYVLAEALSTNRTHGLIFGYEGRVELKGVLGGEDYPVLWLDVEDDRARCEANENEASLLGRKRTVDVPDIRQFCPSFITSSPWMEPPFLKDEVAGPFVRLPRSVVDHMAAISDRAQVENRLYDENAAVDVVIDDQTGARADETSDDLLSGVMPVSV
ncbi:hypothetical protein [Azospirillum rugosum]|uniref:Uncharacterized protein n=1 Tax=Azospirillum rugosum TaxID=416170 RepID=A0ABS4STQ2_9PROT|nr:hypothetical protein [Azospirillum rugosum]MBP2295937.1 hypothetical protein [Azospirillum rugosum]MDQ0531011.1 hypothetical protein [Azospirillum rugosum]